MHLNISTLQGQAHLCINPTVSILNIRAYTCLSAIHMSNPRWRPLTPTDIPSLLPLANKIHTSLPESPAIFSERVNLFPDGCLILQAAAKDRPVGGYTISHPIRKDQPPALDTLLGSIPDDADQYYIHDVVVVPEYRGLGAARVAVEKLLEVAEMEGYKSCCLVSVYGTTEFWAKFGFREEHEMDERLREKLKEYGEEAKYMVRRKAPGV